ncbi:MAG: transcriptional coactivator p15/PC4 family protein [Rhodobacter sp.]|jgi:endo-1,4-beta-mannosidase|nr:transcriptional coactivator p15/PC4 family protein [Rhodobacter sp.]
MIAIPKNAREEIRVSVDDYRGIALANIRVWYLDGTEYRPGKQGIAVRLELVPLLIEALQRSVQP